MKLPIDINCSSVDLANRFATIPIRFGMSWVCPSIGGHVASGISAGFSLGSEIDSCLINRRARFSNRWRAWGRYQKGLNGVVCQTPKLLKRASDGTVLCAASCKVSIDGQ